MAQQYSNEEMVEMLRCCKEENGVCTPRHFNAMDDVCSASTIMRRFGSWTKAKEDAGIGEDLSSQTGRKKKYEDADVLSHLRICADRNDGKVTVALLNEEKDLVAPSVAVERFGSWSEAKVKAGLESDGRSGNHRPRKYTDEDYLELLRECEEEYGKVTQRIFDDDGDFPSSGAVADRFGSWQNAKDKAGVADSTSKYSDEELLNQLRRCKEKYGSCSASKFASDSEFASPETVQRRFDRWNKAKDLAGVN